MDFTGGTLIDSLKNDLQACHHIYVVRVQAINGGVLA